jgi:hypothetical protein
VDALFWILRLLGGMGSTMQRPSSTEGKRPLSEADPQNHGSLDGGDYLLERNA